jgi:hypothetical protein
MFPQPHVESLPAVHTLYRATYIHVACFCAWLRRLCRSLDRSSTPRAARAPTPRPAQQQQQDGQSQQQPRPPARARTPQASRAPPAAAAAAQPAPAVVVNGDGTVTLSAQEYNSMRAQLADHVKQQANMIQFLQAELAAQRAAAPAQQATASRTTTQ